MKHNRIRYLALSGLLTALIVVFTAWLHVPIGKGYIHVGDAFIYLAACFLPRSYGLLAAAGGAALSDCLTGFAIWAPASVLIKGLSVLCFTSKGTKLLCTRNLLAPVPACILCVGGYYLYEALLYGNFAAPLVSVPGNLLQSLCSTAIFLLCSHTWQHWKVGSGR